MSINFGLDLDHLNYDLMQYLDFDTISRLPLSTEQIDEYAEQLNWDILSSKYLPGDIIIKYARKIKWDVFLTNGYPKSIIALVETKSYVLNNTHVFFNPRVKAMYYTEMFVCAFSQIIDWNWLAKNKQLSDYVLIKFWSKIRNNVISKHQVLSRSVIQQRDNYINWKYASKNKLPLDVIVEKKHDLDWYLICKHQTLPCDFITKMINFCYPYHVSRYQKLTEQFIAKQHDWLDLSAVAKYQNMSYTFLKKHASLFSNHMEELQKNRHYNKDNQIQIITQNNKWFILEQPLSNIETSVLFFNTDIDL